MIAASANVFSHGHIAVTASITGVITAGFAVWRLDRRTRLPIGLAVGVLVTAAVYLWRASANLPQLNSDGLPGLSANDWLAPVVTFVILGLFADLVALRPPERFAQVRGVATLVAFAVNVITI